MDEEQVIQQIEQFFQWYKNVYDYTLLLEKPLPQLKPRQAAKSKPEPSLKRGVQSFKRVAQYKQTSPELQAFYEEIKNCQKCALHKTRKNFVFGYGNAQAEVMFVGEAPGRDEDEQGLPFVGVSGKLLDKMFASIGLKREEVYIANVIKCRPPDNRNPLPEEIEQCEPYLVKQIELIQPRLIVALGLFAAQTLLKQQQPLSQLRENEHRYHDIPVIVTYHPSALLRKPILKEKAWQDLKKIKGFLDRD